jgi:hypothetical protein
MFKRIAFFGYGVVCYLVFPATFPYAIGFIGGFAVPTALDGPARERCSTRSRSSTTSICSACGKCGGISSVRTQVPMVIPSLGQNRYRAQRRAAATADLHR